MAVRARSAVKTFAVRFPGYGVYDETEHARLIARHFATEHVELDARDTSPELMYALAHQYDEPMADSSMIPTSLLCQLVRGHCKVALGGDGGDELFGGYIHYPRLLLLQRYARWVPLPIRYIAASVAAVVLPVGAKGRSWIQAFDADYSRSVPPIMEYFDRRARARLLDGAESVGQPVAEDIWLEAVRSEGDLIYLATRADFNLYLPEEILVKVDRASMLYSLEVRAPFLDFRIVEFAFGRVPSRLKVDARQRKLLLRKLAARVLPPGFDAERKQGFSVPLGSWLRRGPWRSFFRQVLLDTGSRVFNRRSVEELLNHQARWRYTSERLFALALFELWRGEYRVTV